MHPNTSVVRGETFSPKDGSDSYQFIGPLVWPAAKKNLNLAEVKICIGNGLRGISGVQTLIGIMVYR